jgi:hypothetical protein
MRGSLVLAAVLLAGLAACPAVQRHEDTLRTRAAFDLQCPAAQLKLKQLDSEVAGVEGCGQRATYLYNGQAGGWILNGPTTADQPPGAAGTPTPPPPAPPPVPGAPAPAPAPEAPSPR